MPIERVDKSYLPFTKDRVRQLKLGEKGPLTFFGGIKVVADDAILIKGGKFLEKEWGLRGQTINQVNLRDPFHLFPPRRIKYRYKPSV